jgi:hypothetical protein
MQDDALSGAPLSDPNYTKVIDAEWERHRKTIMSDASKGLRTYNSIPASNPTYRLKP